MNSDKDWMKSKDEHGDFLKISDDAMFQLVQNKCVSVKFFKKWVQAIIDEAYDHGKDIGHRDAMFSME